jgi:hypothetical protein
MDRITCGEQNAMRATYPARIGQAFAIVTVLSSDATAITGQSVARTPVGVPGSPLVGLAIALHSMTAARPGLVWRLHAG